MKSKTILFSLCYIAATSWASEATFWFDPNDLIDLYTAGNPAGEGMASQTHARHVYRQYSELGTTMASTYTDPEEQGGRWTGNDVYYADWQAGLGAGEGIYQFNMWITTSNYPYGSYSRTDSGEQLFRNGMYDNNAYGLSGTAVDGWTADVDVIYSNSTGGVTCGVIWSTTDPAAFLRPGGADLGLFSFSMVDVAGCKGASENLVNGKNYQVWFGSNSLLFDDQGWGTNSARSAWSSIPGTTHWQAEMPLPASVVPEPASALLLMLGGGAGMLMRRVKRFYRHL